MWRSDSVGNNGAKGYVHYILALPRNEREDVTKLLQETSSLLRNLLDTPSKHPFHCFYHHDTRNEHQPHIHILAWNYRNSPTTKAIIHHASGFGLRLRWSQCLSYHGLLKYLQEDPWKLLLGDTGRGSKLASTSRHAIDRLLHQINTQTEGLGVSTPQGSECFEPSSIQGRHHSSEADGDLHTHRNEIPPEHGRRRIGKATTWETLRELIPSLQAIDYADFERKAIITDSDWYMENMNKKNFREYAMNYINAHCLSIQFKPWEAILSLLKTDLNEQIRGSYCPIEESNTWIDTILSHNGYDSRTFTRDVMTIINKQKPKINTLMFNGPPNCGKTVLANSIVESLMYYTVNNQFNARSGQFALQECVRARVILFDEVAITEDYKDKMLLLFGGSDCDSDVKNKAHVIIRRTPVILCFNKHPSRGLPTQDRPLFELAVAARSAEYQFKPCPQLANLTFDRLHPLVWKYRIELLNGPILETNQPGRGGGSQRSTPGDEEDLHPTERNDRARDETSRQEPHTGESDMAEQGGASGSRPHSIGDREHQTKRRRVCTPRGGVHGRLLPTDVSESDSTGSESPDDNSFIDDPSDASLLESDGGESSISTCSLLDSQLERIPNLVRGVRRYKRHKLHRSGQAQERHSGLRVSGRQEEVLSGDGLDIQQPGNEDCVGGSNVSKPFRFGRRAFPK